MPTISRNARKKARAKRTLSLTKKGFRQAAFAANRNLAIILALLTEQGGEMVVSRGVMERIAQELGQTQYNVQPNAEDGSITISVVRQVLASELPPETLEKMKARMDEAHNAVPAATAATRGVNGVLAALAREREEPLLPFDPTDPAGDPA